MILLDFSFIFINMRKDLTNTKIGKILVIKRIKHGKRVMWECKCDCGNIFYERTSRLNGSEKTKNECQDCALIYWSDSDNEYLIKNYFNTPFEILTKVLNKNISAITNKASRLKLKRCGSFKTKVVSANNKIKGRDLNFDNLKIISSKFYSLQEFRYNDYSAYQKARKIGFNKICPDLLNISGSLPQLILKEFLIKLLKTDIKYNDRKVIKPFELDIFIPKYNIAFEYDGSYWHNNLKNNDELKNMLCSEKGVKLFRIIEKSKNYLNDIKDSLVNLIDSINECIDIKINIDDINRISVNVNFVKDKHFRVFEQYQSLYLFSREHYYLYRKLKKFSLIEKFCSHMKYDLPKAMKSPFNN